MIAPLTLTNLEVLWTLENKIIVLPGIFDPTLLVGLLFPNVDYLVLTVDFSRTTGDMGSIVMPSDGASPTVCAQAMPDGILKPLCVSVHPPPDTALPPAQWPSYSLISMLEYFAPVPGGLSFQVGGQNFGPIGLYQTEQAALAGVGASAAPLQVFWLLGQANVQVWRGDPLHGVPFSVVQDIGSPGLAPYVAPVLTIPVVAG